MESNPWFLYDFRRNDAGLRLFLFPFAGAGASIYRDWQDRAPDGVQVIRVQPPGRENRLDEPALDSVDDLARGFLKAARPMLDRPFALFGHSLGSMVAFRAAALLRAEPANAHLRCLFVSGARPPHMPDPDPIHALGDDGFREALRSRGGTPDAILDDAELFSFFAPTLRADLRAAENWFSPDPDMPDVALCVLNGEGDHIVKASGADGWRRYAANEPQVHCFQDGHFFVTTQGAAVCDVVFSTLARHAV